MKKTIHFALAAAFGLSLACAPSLARAQNTEIGNTKIPSLDLQSADVRDALKALFKNVNVSYSVAPEVQGSVTVSLKDTTFDTALTSILKQVNATFRVEGGIYNIIARVDDIKPDTGTVTTAPVGTNKVVRRLKIRAADPEFIIMMLAGTQSSQNIPEISTIRNAQLLGGGNGNGNGNGGRGGGGGFGGGGRGGGGGGFGGGGGGFGGGGGGGFGGGGFGGGGGGGFGGGGRGF